MRMATMFLFVSAALTAGAVRLVYITVLQGDELTAKAEKQHTRIIEIPAQRGSIVDAQGRVLAGSLRRPSVFVDPTLVTDPAFAAYSVGPALGMRPAELESLIRKNQCAPGEPARRFVWVKREISQEELSRFRTVQDARMLRAFDVMDEVLREYPQGRLGCHVLGFYGGGGAGGGIELSFDEKLRGKPGSRSVILDEDHNRLATLDEAFRPPVDGHSIVLTIDSFVQRTTERHLAEAVQQHTAEWGSAVVMDPGTGEVLALATCPDFDPSRPIPPGSAGEMELARENLRNRAIAFVYEPGSAFKPFVASQALDEKQVRIDEVFAIHGPTRQFGRRTIHDTHTFDSLPFTRIISESSNIGMALIGGRVGNERLSSYVREFGFGHETGIELPGEEAGLLAQLAQWNGYSSQSIPIGQEIGVTTLQLATAFCAMANDGVLYKPRIVRGIIATDGQTIEDHSEPVVVRRVLQPQTAREFRMRALVEAVVNGTGQKAAIPDYQVFGKTGTAQVAAKDRRGYAERQYAGTFIGGAPAAEPRVIAAVTIYRPRGKSYYGGTVAAPTVAAILADTLSYLRVPPELGSEVVKPEELHRAPKSD